MTIDDQIRDEKLQHDIKREAAKISALSSGKINKYEYLTGEEILSFDQSRIIEQARFTYSFLGKAFEKQIKTIEDAAKKQTKAIDGRFKKQILNTDQKSISNLFLKDFLSEEPIYESGTIKEIHKTGTKKKIRHIKV